MYKFGVSGNQNNPNPSGYPITYFLSCHSEYLYVLRTNVVKCKVQTSTELGRILSWKMGGDCSKLLVCAFGVAWKFPQGGNYWAVGKMLLEESSEDVVLTTKKSYWVASWVLLQWSYGSFLDLVFPCVAPCSCKGSMFGYLLPQVCLHPAVSVLWGNMFK